MAVLPHVSAPLSSKENKLTAAQLLALVLLLISSLAAQDADFKIAAEMLPAAPVQAVANPPARGPEKVFDKKFFFVMGSLGAAESLRSTTRQLVVEHEYAAGAPWITSVPKNQVVISKDLALFSSEVFVAYELKKSHSWLPGDRIIRKLWWAYPVAMSAIHVKNAVGNIRTQGPGGCTSMACVEQMQ
jgi:hypothetical protein